MNYLSHYYYDWEKDDPNYILGCLFPDLTSNFKRKLKILPKDFEPTQAPLLNINSALKTGIQRHFYLDKIFHTSSFFDQHTQDFKTILLELNLESINKYYYFYAHILLELVLDRILLQQYPQLVDDFYTTLAKIDQSIIKQFFQTFGWEKHYKGFEKHFQLFQTRQFLRDYQNDQFLVGALNHVHKRINPKEIAQSDLQKIAKQLMAFEQKLLPLDFDKLMK